MLKVRVHAPEIAKELGCINKSTILNRAKQTGDKISTNRWRDTVGKFGAESRHTIKN